MPDNITDVDTFTDPIQTVAHDEFATAANFKIPAQGLANRTRNHKTRLDAIEARTVTAGAGLTGGGALSGSVTLNVVANADASIVVNANDVQVGVISDAQHGTRAGGTTHAAAIASGASGFMTGADKAKLDAIPAGTDIARMFDIPAVKTSAYTALVDEVVRVDTAGGAVTITLPTAVGIAGRAIIVKKWDTGTVNDITVDGAGSETIDGAATATIAASTSATILGSLTLISDGANWLLAARVGS